MPIPRSVRLRSVLPKLSKHNVHRRPFPFGRCLSTTAADYRPLESSSTASSSKIPYSSINPSEISHFTRLSSEWWSETGEFALLHRMNPPRVEYIRQKVALDPSEQPPWTFESRAGDRQREEARGTGRWLKGKRCLDVGCGGGLLSEALARLGGEVVGIDAGEVNVGIARTHAGEDPQLHRLLVEEGDISGNRNKGDGNLEYRCTTAESLAAEGEKFDLVASMEVVEHVDDPGEFLKCLGQMVKPGGHLILSTISRTLPSQLLTLTLAESVLRIVTPGTHTYEKFIKPEELRRFVYSDMGGYGTWEKQDNADDIRKDQVGETRGIVYDPIGGVWRLWGGAPGTWGKEAGEWVNYMYHAKKRLDAA